MKAGGRYRLAHSEGWCGSHATSSASRSRYTCDAGVGTNHASGAGCPWQDSDWCRHDSPMRGTDLAVRGIRRCERDDLPGVATLYEQVVRSGTRSPPPRLAEYFERTFFEYPWADPEIPSLVYEDAGGRIVGFLGSHVRRLRLDGHPTRLACGGQLVVEPDVRTTAVGAFLFRAYLAGPQDITITDGANESVRRMWAASGGETALLKSMVWTRTLRPIRYGGDYIL